MNQQVSKHVQIPDDYFFVTEEGRILDVEALAVLS
jgi:hypothetical protein